MISITIDGENAEAIQIELRALLNGETQTRPVSYVSGDTSALEKLADTPRQTAAQKKAAEKAAKEATENAAKAAAQNISTGEERTDPAVDAQDAADGAADTAKEKAATAKPVDLTHDDVKRMLGGYVQAYGMEAAQADGVGFIGAPKISEIPNTQISLAMAVLGIAKGIEKNPNKRDIAGDGLSAEKTAELKPLVTVALGIKAAIEAK